jgi:hypothetical protein
MPGPDFGIAALGEKIAEAEKETQPYSETVDLNEYPKQLIKLRICRSFRADLLHKLQVIIRAHGGHRLGGVKRAARALSVSRRTICRWLAYENVPSSVTQFKRIDDAYLSATERLARRAASRRKYKDKRASEV